jgi:hypothetical protein
MKTPGARPAQMPAVNNGGIWDCGHDAPAIPNFASFHNIIESMEFAQLFLERHKILYDYFLASIWKTVPTDLLRQRPHARFNSIAWNLWHMARVEDGSLNRFVADRSQVLDEGGWMQRMNLPWRHHGSGMDFAEVDELDERIDLQALHDYSNAVGARTVEIVGQLSVADLDAILPPERVRLIIIDEGLAHPNAIDLAGWYAGWSKGKFLMNHGLSHSYQHLGEIGTITTLLGIVFD